MYRNVNLGFFRYFECVEVSVKSPFTVAEKLKNPRPGLKVINTKG